MTELGAEDPGVVVALRFDETAVAGELAQWCDGMVVTDNPLDPTSPAIAIRVPTDDGSVLAERGDWIVRDPDGRFAAMSHTAFVARHEPIT